MGLFGGSASSSSSLNNALTFNPVITVGDDNTSKSTAKQRGSADATATTKDEFGMSAGVALGPNSNAQGGAVSRNAGDIQPMNKTEASDSNFFNDGVLSRISPLYLIGGLVVIGGGYIIYKKVK